MASKQKIHTYEQLNPSTAYTIKENICANVKRKKMWVSGKDNNLSLFLFKKFLPITARYFNNSCMTECFVTHPTTFVCKSFPTYTSKRKVLKVHTVLMVTKMNFVTALLSTHLTSMSSENKPCRKRVVIGVFTAHKSKISTR